MRRFSWTLSIVFVAGPASATDFLTELKSAPGYTVTVGADARVTPKFEGSDLYEFVPVPNFDIRPMGPPVRFTAPRDGLGVTLFEAGRFNAGPVLHIEFARQVKSDPELAGLGDVKWAWEVGTFAEYWPVDWLRGRVELRKGFIGHAFFALFGLALVWLAAHPKNRIWA